MIIETKILPPATPADLIVRTRLLGRLDRALERKVSLISAPAGFGKTTVVADWVGRLSRPAAWLSLDALDRTPGSFAEYLSASVARATSRTLPETEFRLTNGQSTAPALSDALAGHVGAWAEPLVIVLEDYHHAQGSAVDGLLSRMVDHAPPGVHVVVVTHAEPPGLPHARWRARGWLSEENEAETAGYSVLFGTGLYPEHLEHGTVATAFQSWWLTATATYGFVELHVHLARRGIRGGSAVGAGRRGLRLRGRSVRRTGLPGRSPVGEPSARHRGNVLRRIRRLPVRGLRNRPHVLHQSDLLFRGLRARLIPARPGTGTPACKWVGGPTPGGFSC